MKTSHIFSTLILFFLFIASCSDSIQEIDGLNQSFFGDEKSSATPTLYDPYDPGPGGPIAECQYIGADCGFAWKIDEIPEDRPYHTDTDEYDNDPLAFDANIVISNSTDVSFDWSSEYKVCAVIVKASTKALVYEYPDGICSDTELVSPLKPDGVTRYQISHITFCLSDVPCDDSSIHCYEDETAWAKGTRYTNRGNWAMYVTYDEDGDDTETEEKTVNLMAGKNKVAGTVTFSEATGGEVDITISLDEGWVFYYDLNDDDEDHNVKVQDYDEAPSGNPAPGQFDHKETADIASSTYTITVPYNIFYGVHIDVAKEVDCD